jgi:hypothetical protein
MLMADRRDLAGAAIARATKQPHTQIRPSSLTVSPELVATPEVLVGSRN